MARLLAALGTVIVYIVFSLVVSVRYIIIDKPIAYCATRNGDGWSVSADFPEDEDIEIVYLWDHECRRGIIILPFQMYSVRHPRITVYFNDGTTFQDKASVAVIQEAFLDSYETGSHSGAILPLLPLRQMSSTYTLNSGGSHLTVQFATTRPIWDWHGFLFNLLTVLFMAPLYRWFARIAERGLVKRREQHVLVCRRRRLCPDCRYDLSAVNHAKCPECGNKVPWFEER